MKERWMGNVEHFTNVNSAGKAAVVFIVSVSVDGEIC